MALNDMNQNDALIETVTEEEINIDVQTETEEISEEIPESFVAKEIAVSPSNLLTWRSVIEPHQENKGDKTWEFFNTHFRKLFGIKQVARENQLFSSSTVNKIDLPPYFSLTEEAAKAIANENNAPKFLASGLGSDLPPGFYLQKMTRKCIYNKKSEIYLLKTNTLEGLLEDNEENRRKIPLADIGEVEGTIDVLCYDEDRSKQHKLNPFAINLNGEKVGFIEGNLSEESSLFSWYEGLKQFCKDGENTICTEAELKNALIAFGELLEKMDLSIPSFPNDPNYQYAQADMKLNPIVLINRWKTIINRSSLSKQEKESQLRELIYIPLHDKRIMNAIETSQNSEKPISFISREMLASLGQYKLGLIMPNTSGTNSDLDEFVMRSASLSLNHLNLDFYKQALTLLHEEIKVSGKTDKDQVARALAGILVQSTTENAFLSTTDIEKNLTYWRNLLKVTKNLSNLDNTQAIEFLTEMKDNNISLLSINFLSEFLTGRTSSLFKAISSQGKMKQLAQNLNELNLNFKDFNYSLYSFISHHSVGEHNSEYENKVIKFIELNNYLLKDVKSNNTVLKSLICANLSNLSIEDKDTLNILLDSSKGKIEPLTLFLRVLKEVDPKAPVPFNVVTTFLNEVANKTQQEQLEELVILFKDTKKRNEESFSLFITTEKLKLEGKNAPSLKQVGLLSNELPKGYEKYLIIIGTKFLSSLQGRKGDVAEEENEYSTNFTKLNQAITTLRNKLPPENESNLLFFLKQLTEIEELPERELLGIIKLISTGNTQQKLAQFTSLYETHKQINSKDFLLKAKLCLEGIPKNMKRLYKAAEKNSLKNISAKESLDFLNTSYLTCSIQDDFLNLMAEEITAQVNYETSFMHLKRKEKEANLAKNKLARLKSLEEAVITLGKGEEDKDSIASNLQLIVNETNIKTTAPEHTAYIKDLKELCQEVNASNSDEIKKLVEKITQPNTHKQALLDASKKSDEELNISINALEENKKTLSDKKEQASQNELAFLNTHSEYENLLRDLDGLIGKGLNKTIILNAFSQLMQTKSLVQLNELSKHLSVIIDHITNMAELHDGLKAFATDPTLLIDIISTKENLFLLPYLTHLQRSQKCTPDVIRSILDLDKTKTETILASSPPYPSPDKLTELVKSSDLEKDIATFTKIPFGKRNLDHALNAENIPTFTKKFNKLNAKEYDIWLIGYEPDLAKVRRRIALQDKQTIVVMQNEKKDGYTAYWLATSNQQLNSHPLDSTIDKAFNNDPFAQHGFRTADKYLILRNENLKRTIYEKIPAATHANWHELDAINGYLTKYRELPVSELRRELTTLKSEDNLERLSLCIEMLSRTVPQGADELNGGQELNTTQVGDLVQLLFNGNNKVMGQIGTGEGKSRLSMVLAAYLALSGKTVDCITVSPDLAERDFNAYQNYFKGLGIPVSLITANSDPKDYKHGGVNITTSSIFALRNKHRALKSKYPNNFEQEDPSKRASIVDEGDAFLHEANNPQNYAAVNKELLHFDWVYSQLMYFVDNKAGEEITSTNFINFLKNKNFDANKIQELVQLGKKYPNKMDEWLASAKKANTMTDDAFVISQELEEIKDVRSQNTIRSRLLFPTHNGQPALKSKFSKGLHQCICAKHNNALLKNNKQPNPEELLYIPPETTTLRSTRQYESFMYYDKGSMYLASGSSRHQISDHPMLNSYHIKYLDLPREREAQRVDKFTDVAANKSRQVDKIAQEIIDNDGKGVLIFCETDSEAAELKTQLSAYLIKHAQFKIEQLATEAPNSGEDAQEIINNKIEEVISRVQSQVTITTPGLLGRGADIPGNLHIIQTFISSSWDEIQIKGRAGRPGNDRKGDHRHILNLEAENKRADALGLKHPFNVDDVITSKLVIQQKIDANTLFMEKMTIIYNVFADLVNASIDNLDDNELPKVSEIKEKIDNHWINETLPRLKDAYKEKPINQDKFEDHFLKFGQFVYDTLSIDNSKHQKFTKEAIEEILGKPIDLNDSPSMTHEKLVKEVYNAVNVLFQTKLGNNSILGKLGRAEIAGAKDKTYSKYDRAHAGQAVVYDKVFAESRAMMSTFIASFTGKKLQASEKRYPFENTRKALRGEGHMFREFTDLITFKRMPFANTWASFKKLFSSKDDLDSQSSRSLK